MGCSAPNCTSQLSGDKLAQHMAQCRNLSPLQCETCELTFNNAMAKCRHKKLNACEPPEEPSPLWFCSSATTVQDSTEADSDTDATETVVETDNSDVITEMRDANGKVITEMRASDGMVNGTKFCKSVGNLIMKDFIKTRRSRRFFAELAKDMGLATDHQSSEDQSLSDMYPALVKVTHGGKYTGTWIHPRVLTYMASFLSSSFIVDVTAWVELAKDKIVGVKEEYDAAICSLECDSSAQIEREVRIRLLEQLGGTQCYIGVLGEIDLVTEGEVIEIKWVRRALHAVGQVLGHSRSFPDKVRRIHLFGNKGDFASVNMDELRDMCTSLDIDITKEVLEM